MEDHIYGNRNDLSSLEWIFSTKEKGKGDFIPEYGDLSLLNRDGLILKAVGTEQLKEIASEYMDLLESSSAIYERNGDYALGIFSSGWCRMMDAASRRLCDTDDNRIALESGKWLCHESCWKDASLKAMQEGIPADIECSGGIHLYAVPVYAGGEIVGAINFGYGDPPQNEVMLENLARQYNIPVHRLHAEARTYQSRPAYIIEFAKKRIQKVAVYLGYIIERWLAEQSVRESEFRFRELFQNMSSCVAIYKAVEDGTDFEFLDFNKAGERVEQISREDVIGKRVSLVFPGVKDFGLLDVFIRVWKTGIPETHPVSQYEDGRITGWRENFVFKLPSGELVALYDDRTAQKQAEEELRALKNDLEQQVVEKTRELQARIDELERFHQATIQREFRIKELRDEIERLKKHMS